MKKVMVFGAFDVLHPGHMNFLKHAKEKGDFLIAVVGRDMSVKKIKGQFPVENETMRLKKISGYVDEAVLGDSNDFYKVITDKDPDLICLGYDQNEFELRKRFENIEIIRLQSYSPDKFKSSLLRNK